MIVVSNTTPLISLASIAQTELLRTLFQQIIIPDAVYAEIKAGHGFGYTEVDADFISVRPIVNLARRSALLNQMDLGEAETIVLATELGADYVIIDDSVGYAVAKSSGLPVIRTLSLLLRAKNKGLIPLVKPFLEEMIRKGRWYSPKLCRQFLQSIGE